MSSSTLYLKVHGNNRDLLRTHVRTAEIAYPLTRRASIKDIIEALGIPHTEIGKIISGGHELDFHYVPTSNESIDIFPFSKDIPTTAPTALRPQPLRKIHFMADVNVLKLARNLRMLGIDTTHVPDSNMIEIAQQANTEERILLTRNRDLLKINKVVFGQLLRSEYHMEQLSEVIERYSLLVFIKPFSRCLSCNTRLHNVNKKDILDLLEPLTIKYYDIFKQCLLCKKVYWQGSHHEKMLNTLNAHISFPA
jgi:uncharacterized protein with PIN domain